MKRLLCILTAGLLLLTLCASCGDKKADDSSASAASTTASGGEASGSRAPATTVPAPDKDRNPLTGLYDIEKGAGVRPVAVMVGNDSRSRPQPGIDAADLLIEGETEGGITRLMAVFSDPSRVPAMLGPLRSARPPFISMAQTLGAIFVNYGGDTRVLSLISEKKLDNINLHSSSYGYAWDEKDAEGIKDKGLEYRHMTNAELLTKRAGMLDLDTAKAGPTALPFADSPAPGPGAGTVLQLKYSGAQNSSFTYDEASGSYLKGNLDRSGDETAHKAYGGSQLSVKNVLVLFAESYMLTETHLDFHLTSGEGLLLTGGTSREIRWSCSASGGLTLSAADQGDPALAPGKTFLCIARLGHLNTMVLK